MSDNEYERFEISEHDSEAAFNPLRARRHRPTKNQQIYGIWADDSDDGGEATSSFSGKNRRAAETAANRRPKDYTAPIGFVSGGVQQSQSKDKDKEKAVTPEDNVSENSSASSDSEDDVRPVRRGFDAGNTNNFAGGMAGFRTTMNTASAAVSSKGMGNWEQHTRGIGAKLLLQMGFEPGKGLGKNLQGISQPVQAHLRKGRGAIGAYGSEKGQTVGDAKPKANKKKASTDEDEKEEQEFLKKLGQWRKTPAEAASKQKRYKYKTAQEIIAKGSSKKTPLSDKFTKKMSNVTVIDMTGPEKRVLSGYHALGQAKVTDETLYTDQRPPKTCTNFSLPELTHNIDIILDLCEQEIISLDKITRTSSDRQRTLKHDLNNFEKITELEASHIEILQNVEELVKKLIEPDALSVEQAIRLFTKIRQEYPGEYKEFRLADLVSSSIAPLIRDSLNDWNPLENPTANVDVLKQWTILTDKTQSDHLLDPYSALVWVAFVPSIRRAVTTWNPRHYQPMVAFLDTWAPLLPSHILDNVLEQMILPKLTVEVQNWDPLTDTIPIHTWILPWHSLLGKKLSEHIYPTIRETLGNALRAWQPSDRSARAMLTPWFGVFDPSEMEAFLLKHIVPKLRVSLSELVINPLQQNLECWNQFWEWNHLLSPMLITQMLDNFFFPKWIQTLVIWLNQNPNLDQVSRWYSGWKNVLSEDVLKQTSVKEYFRRALDLMHRSTGMELPPQIPIEMANSNVVVPPTLVAPAGHADFKELVSQRCAERGIIFAPMPGRQQDGKQVYRVGKLFCYIDRTVIMMSDGTLNKWNPVSIAVMLERAVNGLF